MSYYSSIRLRQAYADRQYEASVNVADGRGLGHAFMLITELPQLRVLGRATNSLAEAEAWAQDVAESYVLDGWERA